MFQFCQNWKAPCSSPAKTGTRRVPILAGLEHAVFQSLGRHHTKTIVIQIQICKTVRFASVALQGAFFLSWSWLTRYFFSFILGKFCVNRKFFNMVVINSYLDRLSIWSQKLFVLYSVRFPRVALRGAFFLNYYWLTCYFFSFIFGNFLWIESFLIWLLLHMFFWAPGKVYTYTSIHMWTVWGGC